MIAMFLRNGPIWPGATWTAIVTGISVSRISSAEIRVRNPSASVIAPHDFARPGFWQAGRKMDDIRRCDRADFAADPFDEISTHVGGFFFVRVQCDIGINSLALDIVRKADNCSLGNFGMCDERAFDLGGAHAVA